MTFSVDAQQAEGLRHVGFQERPFGSNRQPWTEWHFWGRAHNLPYCGSFADWCSVVAGGLRWPPYAQNGERGSAYVPTIVVVAKRMGIWLPPSAIAPIGSYPIFDWNRDGNYDHVGFKARRADGTDPDDGNRFFTCEGNTKNGVWLQVRDRKYLVGWVALPLAGQSAPPAPVPTPVTTTEEPMLVKPAAGDKALNVFSGAHITFGDASAIAATGDCKIEPDPNTVTIAKPFLGAIGWGGSDHKLLAGEFIVVGKDKREYKFVVK